MRAVALVALLFLAGCAEKPKFKDDYEEARYLDTLANPTVEQFRRKEQLAPMKAARETYEKYAGKSVATPDN